MSLGKRLIQTTGAAACLTETTDIFGDSTGKALYSMDYDASDTSGVYDGTPSNVDFGVGGQINTGARFNGSSSKITVPAILSSSYTGSVSFSVWFNMSNAASNIYTIINSDDTSPVSGKVILLAVYGGVLELTGYNFATFTKYGTTNVSDGNWHNVIVVLDNPAGTFNVYLDGNLTAEITHTNTAGTDLTLDKVFAEDWNIGSQGSIRYFDGSIDQVRIFASTLSPANVTSLYNEKPETDTSNFKAVLYEGNGAHNYISNVGMDLETSGGLVWVKSRDTAYHHRLVDSVRGLSTDGVLFSNRVVAAEDLPSATDNFTSFDKNGFTLGSTSSTNGSNFNNDSYVSWVFKGGGDAVLNENGTIDSQVSVNTAAGFSIVKYTGNGTTGATFGHGLDEIPQLMLSKRTDTDDNWNVYTEGTGNTGILYLNLADAFTTVSNRFNNTSPTSDVFTLGNSPAINANNGGYIAYCWHSVAGYSKIGSYTGTTTGKRVYVTNDNTSTGSGGFKPSFVMIKASSSLGSGQAFASWTIHDDKRAIESTDNVTNPLYANRSYQEGLRGNGSSGSGVLDLAFNDDGFTINHSGFESNANGETYIYIAIK